MREQERKISIAVIKRLPKYLRYLLELMERGVIRTSSQELSSLTGFTASQIRQDLNNFGGFGQQGYGYNVKELYEEIKKIIGLDTTYHVIALGAGNLGHALTNNPSFERSGFTIRALFDVSDKLIGTKIRNAEVYHIDLLEEYLQKEQVDIAIITLPKDVASDCADKLAKLGVEAIWNFSPVDLHLPPNVMVEHVHLTDSLMTLAYKLNAYKSMHAYSSGEE